MRGKTIAGLLALTAIILVAGCSVTGNWETTDLKPEIARQELDFLGTGMLAKDFTNAEITLRDDRSYRAEIYYGDDVVVRKGKWEKTDKKITFVDSVGKAYTYKYDLDGDELRLMDMIQGTETVLTLKRTDD